MDIFQGLLKVATMSKYCHYQLSSISNISPIQILVTWNKWNKYKHEKKREYKPAMWLSQKRVYQTIVLRFY